MLSARLRAQGMQNKDIKHLNYIPWHLYMNELTWLLWDVYL